ncbi:MAG: hypothetical protein R3F62_06275 [Planctomycetota bacterium]
MAALGLVLLAGCSAPDRTYLELVPDARRESPPEPLCDVLLLTWQPAPGEGALEVALPLPGDAEGVTVRSLAIEVESGTFEVEGEDPRVLSLRAQTGAPAIRVRLQLERRDPLTPPELPPELAGLSRAQAPERWVEAALAEGAQARLVHGVDLEGAGRACAWPEVRVEGGWRAVELEATLADRLRPGPEAPRATRGEAAVALTVRVARP